MAAARLAPQKWAAEQHVRQSRRTADIDSGATSKDYLPVLATYSQFGPKIVRSLSLVRKGKAVPLWRKARARFDALHRALTVLVALAFLSQAVVVQTHIHGVTQEALTELSVIATDLGHAKGKLPSLPDEKNCPLCRLSAFVGSCVVPLAIIPLPVAMSALLPVPEPVQFGHVELLSHNWQGRAPPR
jgi:hypothetical protein